MDRSTAYNIKNISMYLYMCVYINTCTHLYIRNKTASKIVYMLEVIRRQGTLGTREGYPGFGKWES